MEKRNEITQLTQAEWQSLEEIYMQINYEITDEEMFAMDEHFRKVYKTDEEILKNVSFD